ncbi:hypothetical protein GOODEAATRI_025912 [Goodea atripinnis]|uniref:Secreted protein n=1 Tax=Goodea atripinnis TaxID=208336 RepID=A0ABV0MKW2_9TELE
MAAVGSLLQLPVASALWMLGSPLLLSGGVVVVPTVVLPKFLCSGGPLDVCGLDLVHVSLGSSGASLNDSRSECYCILLRHLKKTIPILTPFQSAAVMHQNVAFQPT